jgi:glutamyl-tRNA synthetase
MHLPLILKPEGKGKLSKRDGDQLGFPVFPLEWEDSKGFKERGFLPEALLSYLSLLGWNPGSKKEIFELNELIHSFEVEKIQKAGARFDFDKARWVNHKFLGNSDSKLILKRFPSFFNVTGARVSEKRKLSIYELLKERLFLLEDFKSEASLFFSDPIRYDEKVIKKIQNRKPEKVLNFIIQLLEKNIPASNWTKQLQSWGEKEEIPFGLIMQSLRLGIVGNLRGPDILIVCGLLEKEVILERLKKLINYLNN